MFWSRSTWACELKSTEYVNISNSHCHAPRERVSWNPMFCHIHNFHLVTLHVSVWVEIKNARIIFNTISVTLHVSVWVEMKLFTVFTSAEMSRSTWACELKCIKFIHHTNTPPVTLHVSVWVEIQFLLIFQVCLMSRSTWACELKCQVVCCFC